MPGSDNPKLSAMRISHPERWLDIVTKALVLNQGHVSNAAIALQVHRNTLQLWINKNPTLKQVIQKCKETVT
jgi:ActR/RegA family two-component response regulator